MPTSEALSKASRGTCISTRIVPLPLRRVLAPYHSEHQAVVFLLRVLRSGPSSMSRSVGSTSSIDGSADTFFSGAAIRDRAADNALAFRECGDDATEVAYALKQLVRRRRWGPRRTRVTECWFTLTAEDRHTRPEPSTANPRLAPCIRRREI